jgi:hypothetical protein
MKRACALIGMTCSIVLLMAAKPAWQSTVSLPCLTPGTEGQARIQDIKVDLVATDTSAVLWRNGFGVAGVDSGSVLLISDSLVCTRVTYAVDSGLSQPLQGTSSMIVLKLGPRYIAFAESRYGTFYVDTTFTYKELSFP